MAISVPVIFMANPTLDFFKAGASLVPSPVTATTLFLSLIPITKAYLSTGLLLANTANLLYILSNSYSFFIDSFFIFLFLFPGKFYSSLLLTQSHSALSLQLSQHNPPILLKNSYPSKIKAELSFLSLMIPISLAMAVAVIKLSPVTILTLIPAL